MADEVVEDGEQLYRRVPNSSAFFSSSNGTLRLSSCVFNDKAKSTAEKRPSVDRAKLRGHDPHAAKTEPTQGIVGLVTEAVRNISGVTRTDTSGNVVTEHAVDVIYDPREDNNAHALVTVAPVFESNRPFERLKDSLARLAEKGGWLVEPGGGD